MDTLAGGLLGGDVYKVLRLIMVNSGSAAYVEIPLDQTAALLSKNNKGKTSALNALKLFLLPEVNFKDCKNKFGFVSGGKIYSDLDSYSYYFPCPTSFIILEAENPCNKFCIVLHQTPRVELGYSRIAVPKPYDSIRHLFWDRSSQANQGMGSHPEGMSLSDTQKCLGALGSYSLGDPETIRAALYTRVNPMKPETRFCLMPLVQSPKAPMMRSIKALLQLSFDIKGVNSQNLPMAVANIIDSDVSTNREPINIDFKKIQADRQRLRQDANQIHRLKDNRQNWSELVHAYHRYRELSEEAVAEYCSLREVIKQLIESYEPEYEKAEAHRQKVANEWKLVGERVQECKSNLSILRGAKQATSKDLARLRESIARAQSVLDRERGELGSGSSMDIAQRLLQRKNKHEEDLEILKNREKSIARLQFLLNHLKRIRADIRLKEQQLQSNQACFLNHLQDHERLVINSISPAFRKLTVIPVGAQVDAINNFTELFDVAGDELHFCGSLLPGVRPDLFDPKLAREEILEDVRILKLEDRQTAEEIEIIDRMVKANGQLSGQILADKKEEIAKLENDIRVLSGLSQNESLMDEKSRELEEIEEKIMSLEETVSELSAHHLELSIEEENARHGMEVIKRNLLEVRSIKKELETIGSIHLDLVGVDIDRPLSDDVELNVFPKELDARTQELNRQCQELMSYKKRSLDRFRVICSRNIITINPDMVHKDDLDSDEFHDAYQKLRSEFDNLEAKEKEHLSQVRNHNHETSVEISLLDSMARAITNFEDRINGELSSVKISNLSGVKVEIKTLDGFNTLRRELESHGTTSDQLMDDSFYDRLSTFCDKYLTDGSRYGKLDLEKIVTEIKFIYEINGQKESTSQSNGTSGMVNAVLLAILMKRLVPEDITFTLPVVFDEIGSLDEDNLPELRRVVENHRFVLLVANPNNNGYIAQHIGRWHDIYLYQLTEGQIVSKCLAVYLAEAESLEQFRQSHSGDASHDASS